MKWEDIKRSCLWCWCCGTQEDSDDTDTEEIYGGTEPEQETDNTHGLIAPLNNSVQDEACKELLHILLDETEDSYDPSLVAPLNNSILDEDWEEDLPVVLDQIEDSLNTSALDEACKELLHVLLDETHDSYNPSLVAPLNNSILDEDWEEDLPVVLDQIEVSYNPSLDVSPYGGLCEGLSPRPPSRISHQTLITEEHFTFHSVLGKGAFGKVESSPAAPASSTHALILCLIIFTCLSFCPSIVKYYLHKNRPNKHYSIKSSYFMDVCVCFFFSFTLVCLSISLPWSLLRFFWQNLRAVRIGLP
ncbi:uncharacterized protein LOC143480275 [Brachyhypopomus gauderio]|uniref:uncharacterized protein LOC143480275 n=1 Tax=Brachyhypopomus gauderio TaxID=698409 RepID=UPI00404123D4